MMAIRREHPSDTAVREALLDLVFGEDRFAKTCERLREGRLPAEYLSFAGTERNRLIGTVRLWHVSAGPRRPVLLLGPLAVHPDFRGRAIGAALMERAIHDARRDGHREILLVGDEPYYARFGFSAARTGGLSLPGPYDPRRLLGLSLSPEANVAAMGLIRPTGIPAAGGASGHGPRRLSRAA
jgi:predicted N-acetyltransferase YhbS